MPEKVKAKPRASQKAKEVTFKKNVIYQNKKSDRSVIIRAIPQDAEEERNFYIINVISYNERGDYMNLMRSATAKELRELLDLSDNIKMVFAP